MVDAPGQNCILMQLNHYKLYTCYLINHEIKQGFVILLLKETVT